jgi:hypothetical protein
MVGAMQGAAICQPHAHAGRPKENSPGFSAYKIGAAKSVQAQNEMIDIEHLSDDELRGSRTSIRRCAKNAITEAPVARRALTSKLNQTEADRLKHRPADKFALKSYFPEPSTIEQ